MRQTKTEQIQELERIATLQRGREVALIEDVLRLEHQLAILATREIDDSLEAGYASSLWYVLVDPIHPVVWRCTA